MEKGCCCCCCCCLPRGAGRRFFPIDHLAIALWNGNLPISINCSRPHTWWVARVRQALRCSSSKRLHFLGPGACPWVSPPAAVLCCCSPTDVLAWAASAARVVAAGEVHAAATATATSSTAAIGGGEGAGWALGQNFFTPSRFVIYT